MSNLPKGYKQTEIGVFPAEWDLRDLEEVSKITRLAGEEYSSLWKESEDGEIIALRGFNIGKNRIIEKDIVRISNELSLKLNRSRLYAGDVIYPCVGTIGNAVVIEENNKYHIQQNIAKISPNKKILSPYFLAHYLMSFLGLNEVLKFNATSSQPNVLVGSLRKYKIAIPPSIEEQTAIANALSDADSLIHKLEALIAKKRNIKQGAMQELLTGKKRLPGFSGEWEVKKLGDIAEIKDGTHQTPRYVDLGIPFYSVENITQNDFKNTKFISEKEHIFLTKSYKIEKGDILMTRIGSIGDCKYIDWDVDASFYVSLALLKIHKCYSSKFICHYSYSPFFRKEIELNSLQLAIPKKINLGQISNVKLEIPRSFKEQTAIAQILSDMDAEIEQLEQKLEKYRLIKQGMMQELLTGKTRLV